ncbi:MAG: DUF1559 domain-containing protein [Pirellulales bacterium]|nr:DUF1559 domain-containing protein [Pirellulales bacterium]
MTTRRRGFTLVELLVVIAIIGVLIALLLPAVQAAREAARRLQCGNNLKQVSLALAAYESAYRVFPPGRVGCDGNTTLCPQAKQQVGTSALVLILPRLEQQGVYDSFNFNDGPWTYNTTWVAPNARGIAERPAVFVCPSDESEPISEDPVVGGAYAIGSLPAATGSYALVAGAIGAAQGLTSACKFDNTGVFYYLAAHKVEEIADGLSKTMFVGEVVEGHKINSSNIWSRALREMDCHRSTSNPLNTPPGDPIYMSNYGLKVNGAFGSRHPGGANFAFGDGRVDFVEDNVDLYVYQSMSTRDGNEIFEGAGDAR